MSQTARLGSPFPDPIQSGVPTSKPVEAGMIGLDVGRAIEAVVGLGQGAIGWAESVVDWAESWTKGRARFGYPVTRISQSPQGQNPEHPNMNSSDAAAAQNDETTDLSSGRPWFLSPPVVVLSVAGIAQGCWHYAQLEEITKTRSNSTRLRVSCPSLLIGRPGGS